MTAYDIRAAVRAVLAETDLTDPQEIATKVAEAVPAGDLRATVALLLRDYVRVTFHPAHPSTPPARSAKRAALKEWAETYLRERVHVGGAYLMLGDCSYDNLCFLVTERIENAARSTAAAARYRRLADLVEQYGVERVADLPADVITGWSVAA